MTSEAHAIPWGPTGETVYLRTYSRYKSDGSKETWPETVQRVVDGNLGLVDSTHQEPGEREKLIDLLTNFKALPGGRHLWASGVRGRQFLFNCHVAGWSADPAEHFVFMFDQLMQGGGVGSNYSNRYFPNGSGTVRAETELHIVCDPAHEDFEQMKPFLSETFSYLWDGAIRVEDSREGWYDSLRTIIEAAFSWETEPLVFDFTNVRPSGKLLKTFGGKSAGPMPLARMLSKVNELLNKRVGRKLSSLDRMSMDHYIAEAVVSGGVRRSARMSIKSWKDPDIMDFINCKSVDGEHWSTNISVEIDDEFFQALRQGAWVAKQVYQAVMEGMLTNGEPGFWNRSLSQVGEVEDVFSTNPCGEIILLEWENCNLGHVNIGEFANDFAGACEAHRMMTRFLIRATNGDVPAARQREVVDRNRRIGVGHFGFHSWLVRQGVRFSDSHHNPHVRKTLRDFYEVVRKEARRYAFELRFPEPIKVTTLAPTGSISKMPGATESMQPVLCRYGIRRINYHESDDELVRLGAEGTIIEDSVWYPNTKVVAFPFKDRLFAEMEAEHGTEHAEWLVEAQDEIALADMLAVQQMYQAEYVDNAIAFTINVPSGKYTVEEAMATLIHYLPHLKGTTLMVDETRAQMPYERLTKDEYEVLAEQGNDLLDDGVDEECANGACPIGNEEELVSSGV